MTKVHTEMDRQRVMFTTAADWPHLTPPCLILTWNRLLEMQMNGFSFTLTFVSWTSLEWIVETRDRGESKLFSNEESFFFQTHSNYVGHLFRLSLILSPAPSDLSALCLSAKPPATAASCSTERESVCVLAQPYNKYSWAKSCGLTHKVEPHGASASCAHAAPFGHL